MLTTFNAVIALVVIIALLVGGSAAVSIGLSELRGD